MRDYSKLIKPTPEHYCAYCGKKMERKIFPNGERECIPLFLRRKYCDRECMRKAFVTKDASKQNWSEAHDSARKIVYLIEEREKVCELCGSTENIDVHHKDFNHQNNSPENLILVCRSCHMKLQRQKTVCKYCGRPANGGYGMCNMHYIRWKKYGSPFFYQGKEVSEGFNERADQGKVIGIIQETKAGEFVAQFPSIKEAAERTGVNAASICNVCAGRRTTARGYKWRKLLRKE